MDMNVRDCCSCCFSWFCINMQQIGSVSIIRLWGFSYALDTHVITVFVCVCVCRLWIQAVKWSSSTGFSLGKNSIDIGTEYEMKVKGLDIVFHVNFLSHCHLSTDFLWNLVGFFSHFNKSVTWKAWKVPNQIMLFFIFSCFGFGFRVGFICFDTIWDVFITRHQVWW